MFDASDNSIVLRKYTIQHFNLRPARFRQSLLQPIVSILVDIEECES